MNVQYTPSIRRALISVSDKTGLLPFAKRLAEKGVEIYSTGGTGRHLSEGGLKVHDISNYTGFPEMMDGRLKTLHPKIFGGLLARHDREDDMKGLAEHGIQTFELVVVNLYPFEKTIAREGVTDAEAIEQIDIGGPSLVRAAAKNHAFASIVTSPDQYDQVADEVVMNGGTSLPTRRWLAANAFAKTARYDAAIATYFADAAKDSAAPYDVAFPELLKAEWNKKATLRYGENPHQAATVYVNPSQPTPHVLSAVQLNGKELSYNNYLDLDAALNIVLGFDNAAVSVIKHNSPCGAAAANGGDCDLAAVARAAMAGDPVSAFGSILGCNRPVNSAMAEVLAEPGLFIEAIIAPDFEPEALEILKSKPKWKKNVRLMRLGSLPTSLPCRQLRPIDGGVLVQDADIEQDKPDDWKFATETKPTDAQMAELEFAWRIVRYVKSNAIVLTRDCSLVGSGAGQTSRVDAVEIAIRKAADRSQGSVLASDAFFPFPDSIHAAAKAGVSAIIQPGGSKNDDQVIAACNEHQIPLVMTGKRHFRH